MKIKNLYPYILFITCFAVHLLLKVNHIKVRGPYLPQSWGITKDIFDSASIFIFPWDGWIVLVPMVLSLYLNQSEVQRLFIWIAGSMLVGTSSMLMNYDKAELRNFGYGVTTYATIFGHIWIFTVAIFYMSRKIKKYFQ